jgi:hypothetical protein
MTLHDRLTTARAELARRQAEEAEAFRALNAADPDDAKKWDAADTTHRRAVAARLRAETSERDAAANFDRHRRAAMTEQLETLRAQLTQQAQLEQLAALGVRDKALAAIREIQRLTPPVAELARLSRERLTAATQIANELGVELGPVSLFEYHDLVNQISTGLAREVSNKPNPFMPDSKVSYGGAFLPGGW